MSLRVVLVVLAFILFSVIESVFPFLFHLRAARADLLLSAVLYLALHDDVVQGAALSAVAGYLADLTSATPACLYTFLSVLTFVVVRTAGSALKTEGGIQSAAIAFGASLIHSAVAALLLSFVVGGGYSFQISPLLWSALGTAVAAPVVFAVLRRIDKGFLQAERGI
jgi:rod shape-determining protein MreD